MNKNKSYWLEVVVYDKEGRMLSGKTKSYFFHTYEEKNKAMVDASSYMLYICNLAQQLGNVYYCRIVEKQF